MISSSDFISTGTILNAKFVYPIDNTVVTSGFGDRINPVLNKKEFHDGVDLRASENTNIKAIYDGTVIAIGESKTFGLYLKYKTKNGFDVLYAHLNKILVKTGDIVEKNQIIALSGNTGLSTGAHLHFSLWKEEVLVDPTNYFNFSQNTNLIAKREESK